MFSSAGVIGFKKKKKPIQTNKTKRTAFCLFVEQPKSRFLFIFMPFTRLILEKQSSGFQSSLNAVIPHSDLTSATVLTLLSHWHVNHAWLVALPWFLSFHSASVKVKEASQRLIFSHPVHWRMLTQFGTKSGSWQLHETTFYLKPYCTVCSGMHHSLICRLMVLSIPNNHPSFLSSFH